VLRKGPRGLRRRRRVPTLDELPPFKTSASYWESRYAAGVTSGVGSYDDLARFKADILNAFVREHGLTSVVELGCGDGNQLSLAAYPTYTGYDVAPSAIALCRSVFNKDRSKAFALYEPATFATGYTSHWADLSMSLDVIFHLVEDDVFDRHLTDLFGLARRFVVIYSSNDESPDIGDHVRNREFTRWVEQHRPTWQLVKHVPNPHRRTVEGAIADFWFFAAPG
jgi:SAM-dependent methyltransferase